MIRGYRQCSTKRLHISDWFWLFNYENNLGSNSLKCFSAKSLLFFSVSSSDCSCFGILLILSFSFKISFWIFSYFSFWFSFWISFLLFFSSVSFFNFSFYSAILRSISLNSNLYVFSGTIKFCNWSYQNTVYRAGLKLESVSGKTFFYKKASSSQYFDLFSAATSQVYAVFKRCF
jgi:hypothetical protein